MCVAYAIGNSQLVRGMGDTALCMKAGFSFSISQTRFCIGRIARISTNSEVQKRSDTGLTAKERVLILFYPPPSLTFHSCCCTAHKMFSIQKSKHSLKNAFFQALFCGQCARSAEIQEGHFLASCSFIIATFHQPLPILYNIHSCSTSGLNDVHNSSSQLKKTPSCNRTVFASFALNKKQGLLQIKHSFFFVSV